MNRGGGPNREDYDTEIWFDKKTEGKICLVSYVCPSKSKGKKNVLLLTTNPDLPKLGFTKDRVRKPAAVKDYDFGMGGNLEYFLF